MSEKNGQRRKKGAGAKPFGAEFIRVFRAIPIPAALTTMPDGRFIEVSDAFLETGGFTREEIIGRLAPQLAWKDAQERDKVNAAVQVAERVNDIEINLRSKTGELRTSLLSAATIRLGGKDYSISTSIDITDRKKAEEALRESEAFNASLLRDAPNPILVNNRDGSIRYVNPALERLTGYTNAELLGRQPPYPWWPRAKYAEYTADNLYGEKLDIHIQERRFFKKNGDVFWIAGSVHRIKENEQIRYYLANWVDITERKKYEEALRESEAFNAGLLNNAPNPIMVTRPDGSIRYVNRALEKVTGYSSAELIGQAPPYLWWPEDTAQHLEPEPADGAPREFTLQERHFRRKNGEPFWVVISITHLHQPGSTELYLTNWVEITELKRAENRIRELYLKEKTARFELEQEAKARGLFIDVLAHELRTPVTPVLASIEMLKDLFKSQPDTVEKKLIDNAFSGALTLSRRLEELLDIARYARGTFKLNLMSVEFKTYLNEVVSRFMPTIEQKQQCLVMDLVEPLPVVEIDPNRLEQAISNLISNASKFSPPHGVIRLKARAEEESLVVEVADEGIGISPEEQVRLFQPYHRVEQDRQKFPGIGLGLAVSKQIIEAHGGTIAVESQPDKGSTFRFKIPQRKV